MSSIPERTQILVIGGGPAGSYAASLLARDGFEVALIERDVFPRYHIGESLLPSIHQFLGLVDADELIDNYGFTPKPGAAVKLNYHSREGYTDFTQLDKSNKAYNVVRSEFDDLLLKHAGKNGVAVFEGVKIAKINTIASSSSTATSMHVSTSDDPTATTNGHTNGTNGNATNGHATNPAGVRPVSAEWESKDGVKGTIAFDWLVDASGRAGLMSTQHLKNRKFNTSLKNVACWAYWEGGGRYAPGTPRQNAPWFEALHDETGWSWYIPLHNGSVSVGFVMNESASVSKKKALSAANPDPEGGLMAAHYANQLQFVPEMQKLLVNAKMVSEVKSASDYSYHATEYGGDHFRIAGDAGAFIDPFFSSGVHLAFTGGLSAATTIAASIRGDCQEEEAQTFHNLKISTAYTRFLFLVLSAYKQVRAQKAPVLQDIDEQDFDRAFVTLRPILQGAGDVGKELTEDEVQQAIDFCSSVFAPTNPEMVADVESRVDNKLFDLDGPILLKDDIEKIVGKDDKDAVHVLSEVNSRKPIRTMYHGVSNQFSHEEYAGLMMRCERGKLGLDRVVPPVAAA